MAAGYLEQVDLDRFRPVVRLTELGTEVMAGRQAVDARLSLPAEVLWKLRAPRPGGVAKAVPLAPPVPIAADPARVPRLRQCPSPLTHGCRRRSPHRG